MLEERRFGRAGGEAADELARFEAAGMEGVGTLEREIVPDEVTESCDRGKTQVLTAVPDLFLNLR